MKMGAMHPRSQLKTELANMAIVGMCVIAATSVPLSLRLLFTY
jgi:hypothetical protein